MNQIPIPTEDLPERIAQVKTRAAAWLPARRTPGQSFGHFQLCPHAEVPDELNAATGGIELWVLLGLPLAEVQRQQAAHHLKSFQNPATGLVIDPSWASRQMRPNPRQLSEGDTFFTMTTAAALRALGEGFDHPIHYLDGMSPGELLDRTDLTIGAHHPFAVGDYAALIQTNFRLGAPGAGDQWKALNRHLQIQQDPETGFWPVGKTERRTPWINRAFHLLRSTWNLEDGWLRSPEALVDSCLAAADDPDFYSWQTGYACNDLDLAHVLYYGALCHRPPRGRRGPLGAGPPAVNAFRPEAGRRFFVLP